jgi:hypothetical protein
MTSTILRESLRNAWIRLRFYAPLIAVRTEQGADKDDLFLSYESSKTCDVAAKWAEDTMKWDPEEKPFRVRTQALRERWWKPDGNWNMEMHIGPGSSNNLHIM